MDKLVLEARIESFGDSSAAMATFTLRQLLRIMLENNPNTKEAIVSLKLWRLAFHWECQMRLKNPKLA